MASATDVTGRVETPFTSGAMKGTGDNVKFWKEYIAARPSPTEDFFELITNYAKTYGASSSTTAHDVGTGPGNIARRLATYYTHVLGSDVNEDALSAAKALTPSELSERLTFFRSTAEDLTASCPPQYQGSTDLITVSECMPLLDPHKSLAAFQRLLRPGGTLAVYFYGRAVFAEGDNIEACNSAYDKVASKICSFNLPMKGTPGFPFHARGREALNSYMDNIAIPPGDWQHVQRYKWNCDYPLVFNGQAGFDFDVDPVDRRDDGEVTKDIIDRNFWSVDWSVDNIRDYLDSVYPNYHLKAGQNGVAAVEELLQELRVTMGSQTRKMTFPTVLILATKKQKGIDSRQIQVSQSCPGIARVKKDNPSGSVEVLNQFLQKNHDDYHIFWRDLNGHNHMAHSLLTTFAMGGGPDELKRANEDGVVVMRARPDVDDDLLRRASNDDTNLKEMFGKLGQYSTALSFFEQQIDKHGWIDVVQRYCFSRTELADSILARMYEGAHHPLIHLGLGVEFDLPSIVAEGLAQAVVHPWSGIPECLLQTDRPVPGAGKTLLEIFDEARNNNVIREAPRWQDMGLKMREGVLGRSKEAIHHLAAQYTVKPEASAIQSSAAEVISCAAYLSAAAQRADKEFKVDFFHMHNTTSSIFLSVLLQQSWISLENKARLVEWKGRADLLWYAAGACPKLDMHLFKEERPKNNRDWAEIYRMVNQMHDDGHVAKFIRALKNAEEVHDSVSTLGSRIECPMDKPAFLHLANLTYEATVAQPEEKKWIWGAGFDQAWGLVPSR